MPDDSIVSIAQKNRHVFLLQKVKTGKMSRSELKELEKYEADFKQDKNPAIAKTQEEVAKALKVSTRTVHFWVHDGMPKNSDGTYDIIKIQAWRTAKNNKGNPDENKDKWDIQYRQYKALNEELEYQKNKGELLDRKEVWEFCSKQVQEAKRKFLVLGTIVAPQLVGLGVREIQELIDAKVKEIIRSYYEKQEKYKS